MGQFVATLHEKDSPWLLCSLFLLISMLDFYVSLLKKNSFTCKSLYRWFFFFIYGSSIYDGLINAIIFILYVL